MIKSRSSISDQSFYSLQGFHNVLTNSKILPTNYSHEGYAVKIKFEDWTATNFTFQDFCKLFSLVKGFQAQPAEGRRSFFEFIVLQNASINQDFDNQTRILAERASQNSENQTPAPTSQVQVQKVPDINDQRSIADLVEEYGTTDAIQKAQSSYLIGEQKQTQLLVPNGLGQSTGDPKFRFTIKFEIFAKNLNTGFIYPQMIFRNGFEFQVSIQRSNVLNTQVKFQHEVKQDRNFYYDQSSQKILANLEQNDSLAFLFLSQLLQSIEGVKSRTTQDFTGLIEQKSTKEGRVFAVQNVLYSTFSKEWLR